MSDTSMKHRISMLAVATALMALWATTSAAQTYPPRTAQTQPKPAPVLPPSAAPPDFIIGAEDVLHVVVWGEKEMTGDFVVRSDGKISVPPLDEIVAAGLKPEELKQKIKKELPKFYEEPVPEVYVVVKQVNSKKVFMQGTGLNKQGPIPMAGPMTIAQAISLAGGLQEFAEKKDIIVISATQKDSKGQPVTWRINYDDIEKGKNLNKNNIMLQPGDTVIVRGG